MLHVPFHERACGAGAIVMVVTLNADRGKVREIPVFERNAIPTGRAMGDDEVEALQGCGKVWQIYDASPPVDVRICRGGCFCEPKLKALYAIAVRESESQRVDASMVRA